MGAINSGGKDELVSSVIPWPNYGTRQARPSMAGATPSAPSPAREGACVPKVSNPDAS
jgi:hypothetical protein